MFDEMWSSWCKVAPTVLVKSRGDYKPGQDGQSSNTGLAVVGGTGVPVVVIKLRGNSVIKLYYSTSKESLPPRN